MRPDEIEATESYYFGVWGPGSGHYLWTSNREGIREGVPSQIRPARIDGVYCHPAGIRRPGDDQPEGLAHLHHIEIKGTSESEDAPWVGSFWTILAFWDRSGDARPGSNSAFIAKGRLSFQEMIILARALFPPVWSRISYAFEVRNAKP